MTKTILIILIPIVILIFFGIQYGISKNVGDIETYQYKVDKKINDDTELRTYQQSVFAKVALSKSDFNKISRSGFRILAGYIFGDNQSSQKMAMTAPVVMEMNDMYTMEFLMPSEYKISDLPVPNNSDINLYTRPSWAAASITFGGYANDEKIQQKIEELKEILEQNNIQHKGNFKFMGYNPPYQVFGRRNEIVVELVSN